jgi:hypothetical protein
MHNKLPEKDSKTLSAYYYEDAMTTLAQAPSSSGRLFTVALPFVLRFLVIILTPQTVRMVDGRRRILVLQYRRPSANNVVY